MRGLLRTLFASLTLFTFACSAQDASSFKEDTHYKKVREAQAPADPKKILVEEFFWYGCQHCFHFDPTIEAWAAKKPADVDFVRVPSSLGRAEGIVHSKAFYTAETLGIGPKMHKAIFTGIHDQHLPLFTQDGLRAIFNRESGVLPDVFDATFTGFAVDSRVRRAEGLIRAYAISSVPTVVVGGKYYTNASLAGDFPNMVKVIDALIDKVRKERKK